MLIEKRSLINTAAANIMMTRIFISPWCVVFVEKSSLKSEGLFLFFCAYIYISS